MRREDYKRHWLQRQQQEEEQPRKVYSIFHDTYFTRKDNDGDYVAIVAVYSKHTIITLYKGSPSVKVLWFELATEPICDPIQIGNNNSVHHTIKDMVTEYEMPLYMQWMAEELQGKLEIDYADTLRKKRQRQLVNIDREPEQETKVYEPAQVYVWDEEKEPTEEEEFYKELKQKALESGKSEESLKQLKQYRDKIVQFESRKRAQ